MEQSSEPRHHDETDLDPEGSIAFMIAEIVVNAIGRAHANEASGYSESTSMSSAGSLAVIADDLNQVIVELTWSGETAPSMLLRQVKRVLVERGLARSVREMTRDVSPEAPQLAGEAPSLRRVFRRVEVVDACETCESPMTLRNGKRGPFMGCSKYPECKKTAHAALGVACPADGCTGYLVERSKPDYVNVGETQRFVGCSTWRRDGGCQFVEWWAPERVPCHRCGIPFVLVVGDRRICIDRSCVPEASIERLEQQAHVEKLLKYAVRVAGPMPRAASALLSAAGLACGMMLATSDSVSTVLDNAMKRGIEWHVNRFPHEASE